MARGEGVGWASFAARAARHEVCGGGVDEWHAGDAALFHFAKRGGSCAGRDRVAGGGGGGVLFGVRFGERSVLEDGEANECWAGTCDADTAHAGIARAIARHGALELKLASRAVLGPAAIHRRLLTTSHGVETAQRTTATVHADVGRAIRADVAHIETAALCAGATAIDIGLIAVEFEVTAARAEPGWANTRNAIVALHTHAVESAGVAFCSAAIDIGLFAVLNTIRARRTRAGTLGAQDRCAVARLHAHEPVGARIAFGATAIDVGLEAVLQAVGAAGGRVAGHVWNDGIAGRV